MLPWDVLECRLTEFVEDLRIFHRRAFVDHEVDDPHLAMQELKQLVLHAYRRFNIPNQHHPEEDPPEYDINPEVDEIGNIINQRTRELWEVMPHV
jgi:hypothetical protein